MGSHVPSSFAGLDGLFEKEESERFTLERRDEVTYDDLVAGIDEGRSWEDASGELGGLTRNLDLEGTKVWALAIAEGLHMANVSVSRRSGIQTYIERRLDGGQPLSRLLGSELDNILGELRGRLASGSELTLEDFADFQWE